MAHRHVTARSGESAPFHLETRWRVTADAARVWEVLSDIPAWPTWWPGLRHARLLEDGDRAALTVQSPLGRRLHLAVDLLHADPPRSATFLVSGDLRGTGSMTLQTDGAATVATITWCVVTRHRLLGALRPLAARSHGVVMAAGQRGLRRVCEQPSPWGCGARRGAVAAAAVGAVLVAAAGVLLGLRVRSGRSCVA